MKIIVTLAVLLSVLALASAKAIPKDKLLVKVSEAWDNTNAPSQLGLSNYQKIFDNLPASGELPRKPWSDTYWPSMKGGIAARWATGEDGFSYSLYTLDQLRTLDTETFKTLSPAEKFDIYNGNYDYPTVQEERKRTSPTCPSWEGICHGWSPASLNFAEPSPVTLQNNDGLAVPFAASDIKGLLSFYQGQVARGKTYFVASRCNWDLQANPEHSDDIECRDINAGSFHISITNKIGLLKQGFVADVTRDLQVWNQPVFGFSTSVQSTSDTPSEGAAAGTVKEITVATDMTYAVEVQQQWEPSGTYPRTVTYNYRVELNADGEIIGGEWLADQWARPDFLWTQSKPAFTGAWSGLGTIYNAATGNAAVRVVSEDNNNMHNDNNGSIVVMISSACVTLAVVAAVWAIVTIAKRRNAAATPALTETLI